MNNKLAWVHLKESRIKRLIEGFTTRCSKTAKRINSVADITKVTCPRCIEALENEVLNG